MIKRDTLNPIIFVCGFLLLLAYFANVDVYHRSFFSSGIKIFIYNLCRLTYIVYFLSILYLTGHLFLKKLSTNFLDKTHDIKKFLICFFTGFGIWQVFLLFIGLSGLYNLQLLSVLTVVVLCLSYQELQNIFINFNNNIYKINKLGLGLFIGTLSIFLISKGLYPAGGHDYYNHYFQFYKKVVQSGSILPNEVWYHFFYSKGAGVFFLSMILTDPLSPQLVSTAFIIVGAVIIFDLIAEFSKNQLLPWMISSLFILGLIYTPGPHEFFVHGGWGDLEKLHELSATMILAVIWCSYKLILGEFGKKSLIPCSLLVVGVGIFSPVSLIIIGMYLAFVTILFYRNSNFDSILNLIKLMLVVFCTYVSIDTINYIYTGIIDDQLLLIVWKFINFIKVRLWGVDFELDHLFSQKEFMQTIQVPFSSELFYRLLAYLKFDVWGVLFCLILIMVIFRFLFHLIYQRETMLVLEPKEFKPALILGIILVAFLAIVSFLSVVTARDQPVSFYRLTTFCYAPLLILTSLLYVVSFKQSWILSLLILSSLTVQFNWDTVNNFLKPSLIETIKYAKGEYHQNALSSILKNGKRFFIGKYSLAEAYRNQQGWAGRLPWGGIYPGLEEVVKLIPKNARIWTMHIHTYCMLPDCNMQSFFSFRLTKKPLDFFLAEPEKLKILMKEEGLNYIFVSKSLEIFDPLPSSSIFKPENIGKYFGILWTNGNDYLLTWKEDAKQSLTPEWLSDYKTIVENSAAYKNINVKALLDNLKTKNIV